MTRVTGLRPRPVACGAGREQFAIGDLRVVFEGGSFVGWQNGDDAAGKGCS
ncbi:hypothetical protein [Jannaschia aquimarina]|uniref:hypothetical protein n=1 Tax=Jannaschia aquimarina TaxID=935700 RepID=UPI0013792478|nr:hypothetical protein [Jannaschia aquimarina]